MPAATRPDGAIAAAERGDLREVRIHVRQAGQGDSFVIRLHGAGFDHELPLEAAPPDLVEWLQSLPGFDNGALIEALAVPREAEFVCWKARRSGAKSGRGRFRRAQQP